MHCAVLNCIENENGYCMCSSYVEIDADGCCTETRIKSNTKEIITNVTEVGQKYGKLVGVRDSNIDCIGCCSECGTPHEARSYTSLIASYRYCRWCGAKFSEAV